MPRIIDLTKYSLEADVVASDYLLGTSDDSGKKVRNFQVSDLSEYFRKNLDSSTIYYKFDDQAEVLNSYDGIFQTNSLDLNLITQLTFNNENLAGFDLTGFFNMIISNFSVGTKLRVKGISNSNILAEYLISSVSIVSEDIVIDVTSPVVYYDDMLQNRFNYLFSVIEPLEVVNTQTYVHNQAVPAAVWNINHNLNKYPSVDAADSANTVVIGEIQYIDTNNLTITFGGAFSGKAFLN